MEMVCSRGESLTTHRNQMKLFKTIAATAAVITCCIGNPLPAESSVQVWLNKGTIVFKNDGIPTYGVGQGCTHNMLTGGELGDDYEYVRYPVKGQGFNYEKTQELTNEGAKFASRVIWNNPHRRHFSLCD